MKNLTAPGNHTLSNPVPDLGAMFAVAPSVEQVKAVLVKGLVEGLVGGKAIDWLTMTIRLISAISRNSALGKTERMEWSSPNRVERKLTENGPWIL